ncbi:MAG TPA: arsenic resistance N-acetyltransferase ArsN2, partial [Longimicrobium sp.]|nr:arsenic resistance N-acetyltransferase ArsN2 [Longimicrobium sp.]
RLLLPDRPRGVTTMETNELAAHPGVEVEPARADDLGDVLALAAGAGLPAAGIEAHFPGGFVVARSGPFVVGAAGVEAYGEAGLLRTVAVLEASRGTGLGIRLANAAIALAKRRGVRDLYLLTTTAEEWFPRLGFRRLPREELPEALAASEELRGACPASAVAMHLRLDG